MILLFGGEKGGTGKSTLATNFCAYLAKRGDDVILLDADPQGSSQSWASVRAQSGSLAKVHCVEKTGQVNSAARDLAQRYQHVVIDAGGRDSAELRSAMLAAHKICIPVKASQFDLWTVDVMNELVSQARGFNENLGAMTVISMAPTNPSISEARDAEELLSGFEHLKLAASVIRERKAYRDALGEGRGVVELDNEKAISELESLAQEIFHGEV